MALWKPDPTFYPSPRMAAEGPREKLAYVGVFNPDPSNGKHDSMCVIDTDPESSSYSQVVGRLEMPGVGDEIHHFGWNACSAALCPYAPHPHVERRYLLAPGLRSSRTAHHRYQARPAQSQAGQGHRGRGNCLARRLQPASYDSLRTRRHLRQRARQCPGRRARRHLPARSRKLRRARPLGGRSRHPIPWLRFLVASRLRRRHHQRMGHAQHDRERAGPRPADWRQIRPSAPPVGPPPPPPSEGV